jgi:hypothetical protein
MPRFLLPACLIGLGLTAPAAAADACDVLTAKVIRVTGASLAGRTGAYAVFRAQDAARMSLDCRDPARITLASLDREPNPAYFSLVGLAARALTGADAARAEVLALTLHQDSLLADAPRRGGTGPALMQCETGPRTDTLAGDLTVCRVVPVKRVGGLSHRRRAG